jgi:hypothetical protein
MTPSPAHLRIRLAALGLAFAVSLTGCFNPFSPRVANVSGTAQTPPAADSPIGVVRLYEWCWNRRDPQLYREIFSDDYQFAFGLTDTAGNSFRDRALNRDEELEIAENIFVRGSATEPPPLNITLNFEQNLVALPDSRPGKNGRWHKEIAAQTTLRLEQPDLEVTGVTRIFAVRGDSAQIPQELLDRGFRSDSLRWYIERIEDETVQAVAVRAPMATHAPVGERRRIKGTVDLVPPLQATLGQVLARYAESRFRTEARSAPPP